MKEIVLEETSGLRLNIRKRVKNVGATLNVGVPKDVVDELGIVRGDYIVYDIVEVIKAPEAINMLPSQL